MLFVAKGRANKHQTYRPDFCVNLVGKVYRVAQKLAQFFVRLNFTKY